MRGQLAIIPRLVFESGQLVSYSGKLARRGTHLDSRKI